jgi:hypothetical protein
MIDMVYVYMEKDFHDKNLEKWHKEAVSESVEKEADSGYLFVDDEKGTVMLDGENLSVKVETSQLGYVSINIGMDSEDMVRLVEYAVKKLNRFKSIIENMD